MEKSDVEKVEDVLLLPGFRFHPTDEELVGFYLSRKILQQPLPTELIKQVDIYKYDPWDLPKLGGTSEKEWYFYCPRDRKYRNSTRPNRVTGSGFWKATGTDRPIYSTDRAKCIGLKKSLVFYTGRASKGIKTDWMMHEFRLTSSPPNKLFDKHLPINDSWAICRIFKKTNSTAQRALSHYSWASPPSENVPCTTNFSPENIPGTTTEDARSSIRHQVWNNNYKLIDKVSLMPTSLTEMSPNLTIYPCIDMVGMPRSTPEVIDTVNFSRSQSNSEQQFSELATIYSSNKCAYR